MKSHVSLLFFWICLPPLLLSRKIQKRDEKSSLVLRHKSDVGSSPAFPSLPLEKIGKTTSLTSDENYVIPLRVQIYANVPERQKMNDGK